jgi:hypothetical protein
MDRKGEAVRVRIRGKLEIPSGGIVVRAPIGGPIRRATVNGDPTAPGPEGEIVVRKLPATILLHP